MMEIDDIQVNDDDRGREHIAHPERDEDDIQTVLEDMDRVENSRLQEDLLDLRNNLDNFIRRRVDNHNTHIGLTIDPQVNTVEIEGENYEVVGERFFELNQFETTLGDTGMVQWTALAPEDSWDVENPMRRGEHAVAQNRDIEAYKVTLDGESLNPEEIRELSKDVRIAERSENDLSPIAPEWIARYDSVEDILENEDVSRDEIDEELRASEHRNLITEDYDITLKGLLSILDADARAFGSLEVTKEDEISAGDIQAENLPEFGTMQGSKSATGETVIEISSGDETVSTNRFEAEIDFDIGEINHEDGVGQKLVEELVSSELEGLRQGMSTTGTLSDLAEIFISDYSGEEKIRGSMLDGISENWTYRLIEQDLADIVSSNVNNFSLDTGPDEISRDQELIDEVLDIAGYEGVEELERELSDVLTGIESSEDEIDMILGQSAFANRLGIGRYSFNYNDDSASPVAEHILENTELDRTVLNGANLPGGEDDYGLFNISLAEIALATYKDTLEEYNIQLSDRSSVNSINLPSEIDQEIREVIDCLEDKDLVRINNQERFSELQVSFNPDSSEYDSLREAMDETRLFSYEQLEDRSNRTLTDKVTSRIPIIGGNTEELYIDVNQRSEFLTQNRVDARDEGLSEINAEMLIEDLEDVEGLNITQNYDTTEEIVFEESYRMGYELDIELEEVSITPNQEISIDVEFDQQDLVYEAIDSVRKASKAVNPFNGENIPYKEVVFESDFEYN